MARSGDERSGNDSNISRIEQLIKENTFSREEISRLLEILNSKTENELPESDDAKDTQLVLRTDFVHSIPSQEKQQDFRRAATVRFHEMADGPNEVGASPIDIARAYMASCTSAADNDRSKFVSKNKGALPTNFSSVRPFFQSPSPKLSICWPGVILNDHSTSEDQRGRKRIHEFSRSPYSRSTLSKSKTKEKSSVETVGSYGSVGPIRRIRSKFASDNRPSLSAFSSSAKHVSSSIMAPQVSEGSLSGKWKNPEHDEALGATNYSTENASGISDSVGQAKVSSTRAVRAILEHLDRVKPTPKEKEAELQLTTSWKRSSDSIPQIRENGISLHIREPLDSSKIVPSDIKSKSKFFDSINNEISGAKDAGKGKAVASDTDPSASGFLLGAGLEPSASSGSSFALDKRLSEARTNSIFSNPRWSNGPEIKIGADHGMKPSLPLLAIRKPEFGAVSTVNGPPTFTFPVSATPSLLSDLPTPSILPSSFSSTAPTPAMPSYTFGTRSSTPRLVFSFPSTSSTLKMQDDCDPKFKFGSDNNIRLSFASGGCC